MNKALGLTIAVFMSGCAASVDVQRISLESGRVYEVAKTRSGVEFADCGTQLVSYLFDEKGVLVDSKSERGRALHCDVSVAVIGAGATVGAANQIRRGITAGADVINNSNSQTQGQGQNQQQGQTGEGEIQGGQQGNNGGGNGGGDGSPNGHDDSDR